MTDGWWLMADGWYVLLGGDTSSLCCIARPTVVGCVSAGEQSKHPCKENERKKDFSGRKKSSFADWDFRRPTITLRPHSTLLLAVATLQVQHSWLSSFSLSLSLLLCFSLPPPPPLSSSIDSSLVVSCLLQHGSDPEIEVRMDWIHTVEVILIWRKPCRESTGRLLRSREHMGIWRFLSAFFCFFPPDTICCVLCVFILSGDGGAEHLDVEELAASNQTKSHPTGSPPFFSLSQAHSLLRHHSDEIRRWFDWEVCETSFSVLSASPKLAPLPCQERLWRPQEGVWHSRCLWVTVGCTGRERTSSQDEGASWGWIVDNVDGQKENRIGCGA